MARENNPEAATAKVIDYAFWPVPGSSTTLMYSLPVFHEIDFAVNEGYRKIPHGGIEEGGLLFGTMDAKGTRIEAFRRIECEHASGPAFLLSEQDLETLGAQLVAAASDPELVGLHPVGWFLAHTRSPLQMTDREVALFDHFFPEPGFLTVLVRPERFQPTRFGFLVRGADGLTPRDATQSAIILPLPGRRSANGPVASIPAPAMSPSTVRRVAELEKQAESKMAEELPALEPLASDAPNFVIASKATQDPAQRDETIAGPDVPRRGKRLTIDQVRPLPEELQPPPLSAALAAAKASPPKLDKQEPAKQEPVKQEQPKQEVLKQEPAKIETLANTEPTAADGVLVPTKPAKRNGTDEGDTLPDAYRQLELLTKKKRGSRGARLVMVLPLAALLGCVVGYIAYLQVPSPIIPLTVKGRARTVVVTWAAEETRNAVYAAVRVDDSTPVLLSPEEKAAGRVEVTATPDIKVELIARNWIHDSRGIVRFVRPSSPPAQ